MNIQAIFKFVSLLVVSLIFSNFSFAQSYPDKPIRLISPYGAGGNADLSARALSAALQGSPVIKEPIVVMNRVGAGGTIGSQFVKDSPNDGYTLLLGRVGSQVVAPALDPATPYKWDDFTIIGLLEIDPYVCVVRADSPFKTFQDLLDAVKKNPGKLSYAVSKAALGGLVRSLATDLGPRGIQINAVSPGPIDTPMTLKNLNPKELERVISESPIKRLVTLAEVTSVICDLARGKFSGVTGQEIMVDGGWSVSKLV
jgi:hypothetical protein